MAKYVVRRMAVKYDDGTFGPDTWLKGVPLGLMVELTTKPDEAKRFESKSEAKEVAQQLGRRFYVSKLEV
jgi:hypothetical protein